MFLFLVTPKFVDSCHGLLSLPLWGRIWASGFDPVDHLLTPPAHAFSNLDWLNHFSTAQPPPYGPRRDVQHLCQGLDWDQQWYPRFRLKYLCCFHWLVTLVIDKKVFKIGQTCKSKARFICTPNYSLPCWSVRSLLRSGSPLRHVADRTSGYVLLGTMCQLYRNFSWCSSFASTYGGRIAHPPRCIPGLWEL